MPEQRLPSAILNVLLWNRDKIATFPKNKSEFTEEQIKEFETLNKQHHYSSLF